MGRSGGRIRSKAEPNLRKGRDMKTLLNLLRDESGASAAEYALILAIVGSAIALAAIGLGNTISGSINAQATRISTCTTTPANCL